MCRKAKRPTEAENFEVLLYAHVFPCCAWLHTLPWHACCTRKEHTIYAYEHILL